MREKHLRSQLLVAMREESPDPVFLGKVVGLVQYAFHDGHLTENCTCQTGILILKEKRDYHGIGLVEVMWKMLTGTHNHRLAAAIQFHNTLHRFFTNRGTGIASLKVKLLQNLATMRDEILYYIFLYLHKSYDALDCGRCLDIIAVYTYE